MTTRYQTIIGRVILASILVAALAGTSRAAALSAARNTAQISGEFINLTIASNAVIYQGSLVCHDTNGLATPADDAAGLTVVGRADETVDMRGSLYDANRTVRIKRGIFGWENGASYTIADIGAMTYVKDDQTVSTAALQTNDIPAGYIVYVDASYVWVDSRIPPFKGEAGSFTTLTVSGALSVGGNADITGSVTGAAVTATGALTAGGNANVTGSITGASVRATGAISGASVAADNGHTTNFPVIVSGVTNTFKIYKGSTTNIVVTQ